MKPARPHTITRLLVGVRAGEAGALEALFPEVYEALGQLARSHFRGERRDHVLQPTALVHEAWLKLSPHFERIDDRRHFFVLASRAMRQILADHARAVSCQKRGAEWRRVTLSEGSSASDRDVDLVDLHDSLDRLSRLNPRHARVVELRFLGGLSIADTAETLGVSHTTIEADWFTAKAWLRSELAASG